MHDPQTASTFTGLDGRTDSNLPTWYADLNDEPDPTSFSAAMRRLPRATSTEVAYKNPYTDEWEATDRFNALVEPTRLATQTDDGEPDALFHIPTSNYAVINPTDVYGPLEDVLRDEGVDGTPLADLMFGEIRQYRGGGEVHMDIMFDGLEVTLPDRREPITMGVTTGYDFFGNNAVYVEGFARDTACANSIRSLTDRQVVKHVGDVGDFEQWWRDVLGQLELVANDLFAFIADARDVTVDLTEMPFDLPEFYDLLGLPTYLAEHAATDARASAANPFAPDMWTLHSGATHALTHFFRGKEGRSLQQYVRLANDLLFNPEASLDRVETSYEQRVAADQDGDQEGLDDAHVLAQVERVGDDVRALADQFEEREQQLRERFDAVVE